VRAREERHSVPKETAPHTHTQQAPEVDERVTLLTQVLEGHPTLAGLHDKPWFASLLLGRLAASGKRIEWAVTAIGEAAADLPPGALDAAARKKVRAYVDRCRAPTTDPQRPELAAETSDQRRARLDAQEREAERLAVADRQRRTSA
jgi:hypothetical protein